MAQRPSSGSTRISKCTRHLNQLYTISKLESRLPGGSRKMALALCADERVGDGGGGETAEECGALVVGEQSAGMGAVGVIDEALPIENLLGGGQSVGGEKGLDDVIGTALGGDGFVIAAGAAVLGDFENQFGHEVVGGADAAVGA